MFAKGPLLTIRQGKDGTFVQWLEDLGLKDFVRSYSLSQLIEWKWLLPQYRVIFPTSYFVSWERYPELGSPIGPDLEIYSLLWDSWWEIDDDKEPLWFLHPFLRAGDAVGCLLNTQGIADLQAAKPAEFIHPNGRTVTPYADYFFHWQAYALIDVVRSADCIAPLLNTPDIEDRAQGTVRVAAIVKDTNPANVLTATRRWGHLAEPMTWLSHYRAFRNALSIEENSNAIRCEGARQLADYLGVSAEALAKAVKDQMLVLAQDWRRANDRYCAWTLRAWPYLQTDIAIAMEWLCYLTEKPIDYYLNEWQYKDRGREQWAELHEVLPHEFFEDRQYFLRHAPHYLKSYNVLAGDTERLDGERLRKLVDELRIKNYPFESFLGAYRQLHERLSYKAEQKGALDYRELRPLDFYSLLAIRAEGCLRFAMDENGTLACISVERQGLTEYITQIAKQIGLSTEIVDCFRSNLSLTQLKRTPSDPIGAIMALQTNTLQLSPRDRYFTQAFLCCVLARNYFAHHMYLDRELVQAEKSAFMLTGILVSVLVLLGS